MRVRVSLGNFLIRLGRFIQSLAIMVMRPDDLVEFSQRHYADPKAVRRWTSGELAAPGLTPLEKALIEQVSDRTGRLLLLGLGGGREAIPLAQMGFAVTGVDFVAEMVRKAQENAVRYGVTIEGLVQEVSRLDVPAHFFDLCWLTNSMYSSVPTRKRRIEMLRRVHRALKPGGYFYCSFHWERRSCFNPKAELARKVFAYLTLGNLSYEPGDILWLQDEFLHAFFSEAELQDEFAAGGLAVIDFQIAATGAEGAALLQSKN